MKNMKLLFSILLIAISFIKIQGQDIVEYNEGFISYQTKNNVYIKFENTDHIVPGDTLYIIISNQLEPALIVIQKSSISCVCTPIGDIKLEVKEKVVAKDRDTETEKKIELLPEIVEEEIIDNQEIIEDVLNEVDPVEPKREQDIFGRLSLNSYTSQSSEKVDATTRFRYTFSANAMNFGGSRFSFESYMIYRHKYVGGTAVQDTIHGPMKFYNLALSYEFGKGSKILIGRKINRYISNLGAIDGIQVHYNLGNLKLGAVAGSRPDFQSYGLNLDLMQFGGYIAHEHTTKNGTIQNTLAIMEQRNQSKTDRRIAYFQHNSNLINNLNLYTSFEIAMYEVVNEIPNNALSLSSAYISLRWRPSRKLSFAGSFDARKNVIYFETYKNFIDRLIEQESRQGFRFRFNFRPFKYLTLSSSIGYRYQKGSPKSSKNLYSYISYSRIPLLNASATFTNNLLSTNYLEGQIYGLRLNKNLARGKLSAEINLRKVVYRYSYSETPLNQKVAGAMVSWRMSRSNSFSIKYEGTFEASRRYSLLFANFVSRF